MRTTIDLPDTLYRHIKARAALEGVPVKTLVGNLLQRGLAAAEPQGRSAQPRSNSRRTRLDGAPNPCAKSRLASQLRMKSPVRIPSRSTKVRWPISLLSLAARIRRRIVSVAW